MIGTGTATKATWTNVYWNNGRESTDPGSLTGPSSDGTGSSTRYFAIAGDINPIFRGLTAQLQGSSSLCKLYWKSDSYYGRVEPVPTSVSAKIVVDVLGYTRNLYSSVPPPQVTVTLSTSAGSGETVVRSDGGGKKLVVTALKPLVLKPEGNSVYRVELPPITIDGSLVQTGGDYSGGANFELSGAPQAWIDSRSVTLSRSGARGPIKYKSDPNVTIDEAKDEWVDVDGTGHGHTIYSYKEEVTSPHPPVFVDRTNWQTFVPSATGGWTPTPTWQWDPAGGSIDHSDQEMPEGTMSKDRNGNWTGTASGPVTKTITYTATDPGDNAKATAKYEITIHDQYESKNNDMVADIVTNPRQVSEDWRCTAPGQSWSGYREYSVDYSGSVTVSGGPGLWMADILGIQVQGNWGSTTNVGTSAGVAWPNLAVGEYTYVEAVDHYYRHTGTADAWDTSGFAGVQTYAINSVPTNPLDRVMLQVHTPYKKSTAVGGGGTGGGGNG